MANGTDADNLAPDFKRGNESGPSEGDDQFALLVVHGTSGLATRVRRERQQSKGAVDCVCEAPHDVEVRRRAGEFTFDGEILDPEQVKNSLVREDDAKGEAFHLVAGDRTSEPPVSRPSRPSGPGRKAPSTKPGLVKMYRAPPDWAWWPDVGVSLAPWAGFSGR